MSSAMGQEDQLKVQILERDTTELMLLQPRAGRIAASYCEKFDL